MTNKKRIDFKDSEYAEEIVSILKEMQKDNNYSTDSSYIADGEKYPNHLITFVEKHVSYLEKHPDVDPKHYIANLRLITKLR